MARQRRGQGEGSVYQRSSDGRWLGVVDLGRGPDGRRIRRTASAATKAACLAKLRRLQLDTPGQSQHAAQPITVGEYLQRWLERQREALEPTSWQRYEIAVRLHLVPYLGHVGLAALTTQHVEELSDAQRRDGDTLETRRQARAVLRTAIAAAVPRLLSHNPVRDAAPLKGERRPITLFSPEEVARLFAAAKGTWLYALVVLAVGAGMRLGEMIALTWQDVDLERGTVRVQRTVEEIGARQRLKDVKTRSGRRLVDLPGFVVDALREHRSKVAVDLVLPGHKGRWLRRRKLTREGSLYRRILQRAGLSYVPPHSLRHVHGSLLLLVGVPTKVVQERLGHASIKTTSDIYQSLLPGMQRAAAAALDKLLG